MVVCFSVGFSVLANLVEELAPRTPNANGRSRTGVGSTYPVAVAEAVEELLAGQRLDGHPGEQPRVGLARVRLPAGQLVRLAPRDRPDQELQVVARTRRRPSPGRRAVPGGRRVVRRPARRPGRSARGRRSGPTAGSPCCGRRTGCPATSASRRTSRAATSSRPRPAPGGRRRTGPGRSFGLSPGIWISRLNFGSDRLAMAGWTSAKNAASSQNCSFLYGANGWLWHWAHSSFTPRNSRLAAAARFSGLNSLACTNSERAIGWFDAERLLGPRPANSVGTVKQFADHLVHRRRCPGAVPRIQPSNCGATKLKLRVVVDLRHPRLAEDGREVVQVAGPGEQLVDLLARACPGPCSR